VRVGADWCSLCYADLRPAPPAVEAPRPEVHRAPEGGGPSPRGRHARRASEAGRDPEAALDPELTAEALLAQLVAAESGNPLGHLAGQVDSPGKKFALMVGGAVAMATLLFVLMAAVGALL
jgi:hypothetical protein